MAVILMRVRETLSRSDHQTHRRFDVEVPVGASELRIDVEYAPKWVEGLAALELARAAVERQALAFRDVVAADAVDGWVGAVSAAPGDVRVANLLTVSLDDALGRYRGAGHRHAARQRLVIGECAASPGLMAGPLPPGLWRLTLSAHTLVSDQVSVSIQIDAELASRAPSPAWTPRRGS